jgi:hypothetical protein
MLLSANKDFLTVNSYFTPQLAGYCVPNRLFQLLHFLSGFASSDGGDVYPSIDRMAWGTSQPVQTIKEIGCTNDREGRDPNPVRTVSNKPGRAAQKGRVWRFKTRSNPGPASHD